MQPTGVEIIMGEAGRGPTKVGRQQVDGKALSALLRKGHVRPTAPTCTLEYRFPELLPPSPLLASMTR